MRVIRRLAVPVLVLALATLAMPAAAITIWCEDFCCQLGCRQRCWTYDYIYTTCGDYGWCSWSPECTSFAASAKPDLGEITSPLVCTAPATDAAIPAPTQPAD